MGCNEADVVRSARPQGKKCLMIIKSFLGKFTLLITAIPEYLSDVAVKLGNMGIFYE
jgi:hypothetical protein